MDKTEIIRWAAGAVLLLLAAVCRKPLQRITDLIGEKLLAHAPQWLQILCGGFQEPLILLLRWALLTGAVLALPLPVKQETLLTWILPISRAVMIALVSWGLWRTAPVCRLLLRGVENHPELGSGKTIGRFFENIYKALVAVFAAVSVLDLMGLPASSLIAGAGVAGLAVSLAAQSTLTNLIAGVTLVLEQPFGIGDYVMMGAVEGTVEDISFRSTRLRTPDNVLITVENATVCAEYIHNCTNRTSRLWTFDINLSYETEPEQLRALADALEGTLRSDSQVRGDTVQVIVERLDAAAVVVNIRCYVTTTVFAEFRALKDRLNRAVMETVHAQGCRFALPASRVYVQEKNTGE